MNINKFTQKSIEAIQLCEKLANDYGNSEIDQEHLALSLVSIDESLIAGLIERMGIDVNSYRSGLEALVNKKVKVSGNFQVGVSKVLNQVLTGAEDEAKAMGDAYVSVEHLFLRLIKEATGDLKSFFKQYGINRESFLKVLSQVRGKEIGCSCLDVTCSASYTELPFTTMNYIRDVCEERGIKTVILEGHYIYKNTNPFYIDFFGTHGIDVLFRCGVETFDEKIREDFLHKGLPGVSPKELAQHYQWINLMFGMEGQTLDRLKKDIETGLEYFERINLSIYTTVPGGPARDNEAIKEFYNGKLYRKLLEDPRVDIFDEWDEDNGHNVGHDID